MWKTVEIFTYFLAMALSGHAFAHAEMTGSEPADGAVIGAVESVQIAFSEAVVLTAMNVSVEGKDVPIDMARSSEASTSFSVPLPALDPGRYEVKWSALSREDGHPITGSFSFTVAAH